MHATKNRVLPLVQCAQSITVACEVYVEELCLIELLVSPLGILM